MKEGLKPPKPVPGRGKARQVAAVRASPHSRTFGPQRHPSLAVADVVDMHGSPKGTRNTLTTTFQQQCSHHKHAQHTRHTQKSTSSDLRPLALQSRFGDKPLRNSTGLSPKWGCSPKRVLSDHSGRTGKERLVFMSIYPKRCLQAVTPRAYGGTRYTPKRTTKRTIHKMPVAALVSITTFSSSRACPTPDILPNETNAQQETQELPTNKKWLIVKG